MKKDHQPVILLLLCLPFMLQSCSKPNKVVVDAKIIKKERLNAELTSVKVTSDLITIQGSGFLPAETVKIVGTNFDEELKIDSLSNNTIVLKGNRSIAFMIDQALSLVISNAEAEAIYPITFTLQNGAVTANMLSSMGATSGQVLKFNGTNWAPASLSNSQVLLGTWDPGTNNPNIDELRSPQTGTILL